MHERFIEKAIAVTRQDQRLKGLLAGGSMVYGTMDEFSDLDFIIVYHEEFQNEIMAQRLRIAEGFGNLLSAFTGEHVGEPRLIICLYGPVPLHVDLKFVHTQELASRIENPKILWERDTEITTILDKTAPQFPYPDPQWMEDRFWVWVHYGAAKLGRGELYEVIDLVTYMRSSVVGPLVHIHNGQQPRGVRRLEQSGAEELGELNGTVPSHSFESCYRALKMTINLYLRLRPISAIITKSEAERTSVAFLDRVYSARLQ